MAGMSIQGADTCTLKPQVGGAQGTVTGEMGQRAGGSICVCVSSTAGVAGELSRKAVSLALEGLGSAGG